MLLGGCQDLIGGGSSCPDGKAGAKLAATFVSTCPATFVPASGTLHLDISDDGRRHHQAALDGVRAAGINAAWASVTTDDSPTSSVCVPATFNFGRANSDEVPLQCPDISFAQRSQTVTCRIGRSNEVVPPADAADTDKTCTIEFTKIDP